MLKLLAVPHLGKQLQAIQALQTLESNLLAAARDSKAVLAGCATLMQSLQNGGTMQRVLHVVLNTGNFLNGQAPGGRARAFDPNSLPTLLRVKGKNGSILQYTARQLMDMVRPLATESRSTVDSPSPSRCCHVQSHIGAISRTRALHPSINGGRIGPAVSATSCAACTCLLAGMDNACCGCPTRLALCRTTAKGAQSHWPSPRNCHRLAPRQPLKRTR